MILFLSNGAGEDAIAGKICSLLNAKLLVKAMPLLGSGPAYPDRVERIGVLPPPPSLGLSNESWRLLWRDLRHGLVARLWVQWKTLRQQRPALTVVVGDLLPVGLAALGGLGRVLFVGTAKSSYYHPYSRLERALLARWTRHIFARDARTAEDLGRAGLPAQCVGNVMMDELARTSLELPMCAPGLALLPGSRSATYAELPRLLDIVAALGRVQGVIALAEGVDLEQLVASCPGWVYSDAGTTSGLVGQLRRPALAPVLLVKRALGDVLAACQVCLGQAGTGNEQAAGAGLPVVALHERPERLGWYRGRQLGLLGEALEVVAPNQAVPALERLFADPNLRARRGAVGKQRMGEAGGARAIARFIEDCVR
jgi:uncharacterized protein (TIGR03492 family)